VLLVSHLLKAAAYVRISAAGTGQQRRHGDQRDDGQYNQGRDQSTLTGRFV